MAPRLLKLFPRKYSSHSSASAGGIGGGVVAAIIAFVLIAFVCVYIHEYRKAQRLQAEKNIPISKGKIFKKAALTALTFGLIGLLCAECCSGGNSSGTSNGGEDGGGGGNGQTSSAPPQMDPTGGGFVAPPMPSYQPQMDITPISNAAQDEVQG